MAKKDKLLFKSGDDWTPELLEKIWGEIEVVAKELRISYYPPQFEIVSAAQMLEAYTSHGMPTFYKHWSFGMQSIEEEKAYEEGHMNLAYELVINCLKEDTHVITKDRGIIEIKNVIVGDQLWNGKTYVPVTRVVEKQDQTTKIVMNGGISLVCTEDHIHPVIGDNGFCLKKTKELTESDWMLVPTGANRGDTVVDLSEFEFTSPLIGFGEKFAFNPYCEIPPVMTPQLAELIGIIVGDGCMSHYIKRAFQISVGWDAEGYEKHVQKIIYDALKIDSHTYLRPSTYAKGKNNFVINVCSEEVKSFLDFCGLSKGMTHKNKRIPWSILESSTECKQAFLRGLFDTDGCVKQQGGTSSSIGFSCYNSELGADVSHLLWALGIPNSQKRINNDWNNISTIDILSEGKKVFAETISSSHPKKFRQLQDFINRDPKYSGDQAAISRIPPSLAKEYGLPISSSRKKALELSKNSASFADYRYVKVDKIEAHEVCNVVDVEVNSPDHLFWANGVLTHNCDPCIAYLMEQNSALMQTLVMSHANIGHSAVFKNNYLFKQYTDAEGIIDYLDFAKNYIKKCEEKYGEEEVEFILDACHTLGVYSVDKYRRSPKKLEVKTESEKAWENFDPISYRLLPPEAGMPDSDEPFEPQENILYFLEKKAPFLAPWKKEIIRIIRKINQYFHPQRLTQVVNEGYATFVHYYITNRLYDKGLIDGGSMLEFFASHSGVVAQYPYNRLNPYKLGLSIYQDIKRICENPTEEDKTYFPDLIGKDWVEEINYAMMNFSNETFILQYLSPQVARDLQLFAFDCNYSEGLNTIEDISDETGFRKLREKLASSYCLNSIYPDIRITDANFKTNRVLTLEHFSERGHRIHSGEAQQVINYIAYLWGYPVKLLMESPSGDRISMTSNVYLPNPTS